MTDREKIISNDFYDLVIDFRVSAGLGEELADAVFQPVDGQIGVAYVNRAVTPPMSVSNFTYPAIPKIYGLMQNRFGGNFDPTQLIQSGITQVQEGALGLTGRGVVIGFIDTGDGVILLSGQYVTKG